MFTLDEIERLQNLELTSFSGFIPRISNKNNKLRKIQQQYESLYNERVKARKEADAETDTYEKRRKMENVSRIDKQLAKLSSERNATLKSKDDSSAPLKLEYSRYFNDTILFALKSILSEENLSISVQKINKETLDPEIRKYVEKIFDTLLENKRNPKVKQNISDVVNFFFSTSGKGNILMKDCNYAKEVNIKNQRRCVNWFNLLQCCENPQFVFKGSKIEKYFEKEAERINDKYGEKSY